MRKFFQISFLFIYLFSIVGINISSHFCGDYLVSVDLNVLPASEEPDNCCSNPCEDDCCANEVRDIKIADNQNLSFQIDVTKYQTVTDILLENSSELIQNYTLRKFNLLSLSPPDVDKNIINCTWLI